MTSTHSTANSAHEAESVTAFFPLTADPAIDETNRRPRPTGHHLVVIHARFVPGLLTGRKRVECRLTKTKQPPFGTVRRNDVLWFKIPSGPIVARACVRRLECLHPLTIEAVEQLAARYARDAYADRTFFRRHLDANYGTIIHLGVVHAVPDLPFPKRDGRAWVVLPSPPPGAYQQSDRCRGATSLDRES